jgi:hypothetical protein
MRRKPSSKKSTNTKAKRQKWSEQMAIISMKEIKEAIKIMMEILEKLDAIYHALKDNKPEE